MRGQIMLGQIMNRFVRNSGTRILAIALLVGAASLPLLLKAQGPEGPGGPGAPAADNGPGEDPPSRAARLGLIQGNVTFQPGGVEDWIPATLNRPITTGDRLWTDAGARTELHLGSLAFRLNGRTNFTFVNLTDSLAQVQVSSGSLNIRVRRLADQESVEIDTPQAAFTLLRPGEYRIDVNEQGDATVATVRGGDAEVAAGGQLFPVHARDQVRVMEENGQPVFDRRTAPVADAFDNFCANRDRREDTSPSARYVSREMPGYADLDEHGVWREEAGYGMVWVPRVEVGWAPYHHGHWAWVAPWGWTWVDDAPWGYAPFHYGRWAFAGGGWVWVPGPVVVGVRPVYAPALVGWVGGGGFSVSVGVGVGPAVGWFALGPREVWVPPYRYSPTYITQVNVTNTVIVNRTVINNVNVTNVNYVNRGVAGAVTVVPQNAMVTGRPVAAAAVVVPAGAMARAQVGFSASVAPQRGAVLSGQVATNVAPPPALANRQFVARATPPPAPVSFNQQQAALQQNGGQPLSRAQYGQLQQSQPQAQQARPAFRSAIPQQQNAAPGGNGPAGNGPGGNGPGGNQARPGFGQGQNAGQNAGQPGGQNAGQGGGQNAGRPVVRQGFEPPALQPGNGNQPNRGTNQGVGGNPPGGPGGLPMSQARQDVTRPQNQTPAQTPPQNASTPAPGRPNQQKSAPRNEKREEKRRD